MKIVTVFLVLGLASSAWCNTGKMTFNFDWQGKLGSCRLAKAKTDHFYNAALSKSFMKPASENAKPEKHELCNPDRCIEVTGRLGKVVLKISDTCIGCAENDIKVADTAAAMLDDVGRGKVKVSWRFVNCQSNPPGKK